MIRHYVFAIVLMLLILFALPESGSDTKQFKITTDSKYSYVLEKIESGAALISLYENDLDIFRSAADELRNISAPETVIITAVPTDATDAATIGASLLDRTFDNWSEAGTICVYLYETANAWIVFGQMKDRNSTSGSGTIAIGADTGEVLYHILCQLSGR